MTTQTKHAIKKIVTKNAKNPEKAVAQIEMALKKDRKPIELPAASLYEFKEGEQVALVSANGKMRSHYEYVERLEKFDVVNDVTTGKTHRVWLNKLVPTKVGLAMKNAQERAAKTA